MAYIQQYTGSTYCFLEYVLNHFTYEYSSSGIEILLLLLPYVELLLAACTRGGAT